MIAQFLYRNPRILLLIILVIVVAGLSSFFVIPRLEDPILGKRVAVISTVFPGADARRVESLVTIPLEEQLQGITEIDEVRSNSRAGISNIVLELTDDAQDVDAVWSLVRGRVEDAKARMPAGCREPAFEIFPLKAYAAIIAIKPRNPQAPINSILRKLAGQLRLSIGNIRGTESVAIFGDPGEEFVAEIEPTVFAGLGVPIGAIARQVADSNVTQPAGSMQGVGSGMSVDVENNVSTRQQLADTLVQIGAGSAPRKLSDLATVKKRLTQPPGEWALVDGQPAIVLGALVDNQMRVDRWAKSLDSAISRFQDKYSADLVVEIIFSQSDYIESRLHLLLKNLLLGAGAVTAVVLLLMGWRSMLVVGVTLPLASLMVLAGMRILEIPLHQMSITGLIVALGLLIDNAIVMVEDVRSRIIAGKSPARAISLGIRHLAMPLFGSSMTTALAFMPIATLPGPPGEFVGTIAMSVILAIASSFLLAMTVVPALLALLRIDSGSRSLVDYGFSSRLLTGIYRWTLQIVFRFPVLGILLGMALPALGFYVARDLPEQFFPASDRNQIQIEVELPAREPIEQTLATVRSIEQTVDTFSEVERSHWFVGRSAPTFYYNVVPRRRGTPFYAQAILDLAADADFGDTVLRMQAQLDQEFAQCRVIVRQLEQGPPFDAPIEIRLAGPDLSRLQQLGGELRVLLSQTSSVIHTRSDSEETIPKLVVQVDSEKLARAGLSEMEVAQQLYTMLDGAPAGKILDGDEELPVRIKMAETGSNQIDRLAALQLPIATQNLPGGPPMTNPPTSASPNTGPPPPRTVPLAALASLELGSNVAAIVRINGQRTNEVKAYITAGVLPSTVVADFKRRLAESDFSLPPGYEMTFKGENAERTAAVESLIANAVVLFAMMILTLVISFRSFRYALIVIVVGALAAALGPLALWLFDYPFGFMAIVGTMGLVGVAINDSIVVLAAIRENPEARRGNVSELVEVVVGSTRHIIATTITTMVGFTPLILGGGRFWPPLAITVAGGVGGATILALYFVPCLSRILHGPSSWPSDRASSA